MFGHVAFREHSSRWPTVPFLVAMALAWSFAMIQSRAGELRVSLGTILTIAVGLPALRVGVMLIGGRRRRRERKAERAGEADDAHSAEESETEENRPTYGDIFGAPAVSDGPVEPGDGEVDGEVDGDGDVDEPSIQVDADGDGPWMNGEVEAGDGDGMAGEVEAGGDDGMAGEVETTDGETDGMSANLEPLDAEVDETSGDVDAIRSELESEEAVRRLREEFKARAREAELRIKQRQAELEQAPSA